ncbi:hypothetical protein TcWFU_008918 [Taenia crassiceps]|uniref:Uncharacterized protein n=1 Tax=Taenia crassiceps TaxID=6207 RepID=A0ABR4Q6K4_9CEST
MREVVLKKGNRGFLDLFWDIASPEIDKRDTSIKNLKKHLSVQRNGLRSSSRASKEGFASALTSILQSIKDVSTEALFLAFDKNVFSFKAHDAKELVATNLAKIDCLDILYQSGRLAELQQGEHKKLVSTLTPLAKVESCLRSMQSVVSLVVPHLEHNVITLYGDLISQMWNSAWKAEEPTASQLLFILRLQDHPQVLSVIRNTRKLQTGDKSVIKRVTDEQFRIVVTPAFLAFLRKQLSNSKLSSHEDICCEVNFLLSHFRKHVSEENSMLESNNDCRFSSPNESAMCASHLLTIIAGQMPLFDAAIAPKAPRLLSSLLDCSSAALSEEYLHGWSQSLQKLFLTVKEDSTDTTVSVDRQRLHILELLRSIVFLIISHTNTMNSLEFFCEALDFLLLVANGGTVSPEAVEVAITTAVAEASLTQLGRCLALLIRLVPLRTEMRSSSKNAKCCRQIMQMLVNTMRHLVETDTKICSDGLKNGAELLERLKTARTMLEGEDDGDVVEQWIGVLYASTIIYTVTLHSNPPSPKEMSILSLLDDIFEAHRHRLLALNITSNAMDTSHDAPAAADSDSAPEWSAVLTDTMLSLCVEPWRLLRDVVGATFGRLVVRRELYAPPLGPPEVVFGVRKKEAEQQNGEALSPLQLILSIADSRSKAAQERIAVAGEEEDGDDSDESLDGSSSEEEEEGSVIGGFAGLEVEDLSAEAKIEDGDDDDKEEEKEEEFLSNEQMEEQDEALAAMFRAARSSKTDAKSRKETVTLLKLRSFDFLEYLLLYTSDANLFLPTLYTIIQMAVTSTRRAKHAQNQRPQGNKGGHVPLARIASCLDQLRSRPLLANELLWQSICQSDEALLPICFKAIFRVFRNAIPDDKLIKCLQTACEFLQFKKVADQNSRKLFNMVLEDVLSEFLSKMHPSKTHQLLLARLITSSPDLAELTGRLVIERLKATLQSSTSSSQSNSSCTYAETALLSLINAVTSGLAGSKSPYLSDWVLTLSRTLIGSFFMNSSNSTWAKSKALTVAVFECLFNCFKSDKTAFEQLTAEEWKAILTSDRANVPKAARPYHSRLTQLIRSLRASSQYLAAVLEGLDTQRKLEKAEAKQERRRKRKAKAAAGLAAQKKAKLESSTKPKKA